MTLPFRLVCIAAMTLGSCVSAPALVGGGEVRNMTSGVLHQVQVVHHPTGRMVFAQTILPGRALKLGFSPREMKARYADLTWRTADGREHTARLDAPKCPPELVDEPAWVVYSLQPGGAATVELVPMR